MNRKPHPNPGRPAFRLGGLAGALAGLGLALSGCDRPKPSTGPSSQALPGTAPSIAAPAPSPGTNAPAQPAPPGMAWIPGGEFEMGGPEADQAARNRLLTHPTDPVCTGLTSGFPDARPIHRVRVDGFWMDLTEVTNAEFERFVQATGYVTVAERTPTLEQYPGADPAMLVPGSVVFTPPSDVVPLDNPLAWWSYVPGANWRHPFGPGSDLAGKENVPVVHVCYLDAQAYCAWAGKRLPTEAEWEWAARGGLARADYAWGNEQRPGGRWMANSFQGRFPFENSAEDGFAGIAPVRSFPANGHGLFDMAGNVWEWCSDWYRPDTYQARAAAGGVTANPVGPTDSHDPDEPGVPKRVQRGGSFLCSDQYCARFRIGTRGKGAPDTGSTHVGFRCVKPGR